jgi:hypothetical protein
MDAHRNHGPPATFDQSPIVSNLLEADISLGPHFHWSPERRSRGSLSPPPDPENEFATKRGGGWLNQYESIARGMTGRVPNSARIAFFLFISSNGPQTKRLGGMPETMRSVVS